MVVHVNMYGHTQLDILNLVSVHTQCPCAPSPGPSSPSFVGSNCYCESGVLDDPVNAYGYYLSDPLWDGSGCTS